MTGATINHASIKLLVDTFYQNVREIPELQLIFENEIGTTHADWQPHLDKMYSFWNSILLKDRSYRGRPMVVHREIPYFPPELFDVWLAAFHETTKTIFSEEDSTLIFKRAEAIAQSLKAGIY